MELLMTLPNPLVFSCLAVVFYSSLVGRRVDRVAYNVAEHLVGTEGTGVSKSSMSGLRKQITPKWAAAMVWVCSFLALGFMIYFGFRYGVVWAIVYAACDHILKKLEIPIFPSVDNAYSMISDQAEKRSSSAIHRAIEDYRPNYEHLK